MMALLPESTGGFWMKSHNPLKFGLCEWLSLGT